MIPDCTLTTACFDLTKYNNYSRSLIDSINNMRTLLEVPCYLVIYTDENCINIIKEIRDSFNLNHLTKYIVTKIEQLYFYKYNNIIKSNREKYFPTRDDRTCSESHLICSSKFQFVLETIQTNPFNTTKFGWIDSNLNQNFSKICEYYKKDLLLTVLHNSYPDKFHLQILNVTDKKYKEVENKREYYERYRWVVCGCLFITNIDIGLKILKRLNEIFEETTTNGYGHGEEMFYLEVLDEFYTDIEKSYGDYGQIINNFIYPTRNINYIYHCIIRNYLQFGYHRECYDCCKKVLYSIEKLNISCDANIYMSILFSYYVSSFYFIPEESIQIVNHIYDICKKNANVQLEFDKNKDFYLSQFNYCKK